MNSARKSSRSILGSTKGKLILAGLIVAAALAAGTYLWFGGSNGGELTQAERVIGGGDAPDDAGTQTPFTANTAHSAAHKLIDVDAIVVSASGALQGLQGAERHAALVRGYERMVETLQTPLAPDVRKRVLPVFHQFTDELFFSNIRNEFSDDYIVKPGDSVAKIASRHGVTEELLCDWNNITPDKKSRISVGQSFKIVKGKPTVKVDKSDFCLSFYFGDKLARQYIVAHGRGNNTPEGETQVTGKTLDPDKTPYAGPMQKEMDKCWMGFGAVGKRTGIGIHGTKYPESIPGETSHGCIRMYGDDVVQLYRWTPNGTKVAIVG